MRRAILLFATALALLLSSTSQAAFLQPDPKQFAAGDYNLYRYCHNDPVNKTDPLGLYFSFPEDKVLRDRLQTQLKEIGAADKRLGDMIKQLADSKNKIELRLPDKKGDGNKTSFSEKNATNGKGTGSVIRYDPDNKNVYAKSPIGSLTHELRHAQDADSGVIDRSPTSTGLQRAEERAVQRANILFQNEGIPLRTTYGGIPLSDPTPQ